MTQPKPITYQDIPGFLDRCGSHSPGNEAHSLRAGLATFDTNPADGQLTLAESGLSRPHFERLRKQVNEFRRMCSGKKCGEGEIDGGDINPLHRKKIDIFRSLGLKECPACDVDEACRIEIENSVKAYNYPDNARVEVRQEKHELTAQVTTIVELGILMGTDNYYLFVEDIGNDGIADNIRFQYLESELPFRMGSGSTKNSFNFFRGRLALTRAHEYRHEYWEVDNATGQKHPNDITVICHDKNQPPHHETRVQVVKDDPEIRSFFGLADALLFFAKNKNVDFRTLFPQLIHAFENAKQKNWRDCSR